VENALTSRRLLGVLADCKTSKETCEDLFVGRCNADAHFIRISLNMRVTP